jgi:hypothetical protein
MARIRTIKPETFTSESISALTLAARWTFVGLWTHVDDEGRCRDNAKIIRGALWPNEDETVTSKDVEAHLAELEHAEMICRYEAGGARYIHVVNFHKHQKISHPTPSKLPECPHAVHPAPKPPPSDDSGSSPEDSGNPQEPSGLLSLDLPLGREDSALLPVELESSPELSGLVRAREEVEVESGSGSGGLAPVPPPAGRRAPRTAAPLQAVPDEPTAQLILGEYLDRCAKRPPGAVIGQLGKLIKAMLAESIDPDDIRRGMAAWKAKGLHPATLPSVVNEVMNARPAAIGAPSIAAAVQPAPIDAYQADLAAHAAAAAAPATVDAYADEFDGRTVLQRIGVV